MSIKIFLSLYLLSVPLFIIGDLLWLGVIAKSFYQSRVGHLMEINWLAAGIFYIIFMGGLIFFAIYPALNDLSFIKAILLGALFGFITYFTYDFTNLATLKDWSWTLALVDVVWGTVLCATVSGLAFLAYTKLFL